MPGQVNGNLIAAAGLVAGTLKPSDVPEPRRKTVERLARDVPREQLEAFARPRVAPTTLPRFTRGSNAPIRAVRST